jgi:hypothetical protein
VRQRTRSVSQSVSNPGAGKYARLYKARFRAPEGSDEEEAAIDTLLADIPDYFRSCLSITPKGRKRQPFELNKAQLIVLEAIQYCLDHDLPIRIVILKARQKGLSTFIAGLIYMWSTVYRYSNSVVMAQKKKNAQGLFRMYEKFFSFSPEDLRPDRTAGEATRSMEFGDVGSRIGVLVSTDTKDQEDGEAGRGETYHYGHMSEIPYWNNADATAGSLFTCFPKESGTALFLESTAGPKGDYFSGQWDMSHKWADRDSWDEHTVNFGETIGVFIPWQIDDEYTLPFRNPTQRKKFEDSLGDHKNADYGNERELLDMFPNVDVPYEITLEHLNWRRVHLKVELSMNLSRWSREFPSSPEEAFRTAGGRWLNAGILFKHAEIAIPPVLVGRFEPPNMSRDPVLLEESNGWVQIFEPAQLHAEYVIGVDNSRGNDEGDFQCGTVLKRFPETIVAEVRGRDFNRPSQTTFAFQLYYMALHYNNAWICLEANYGEVTNSVIGQQLKYNRLVKSNMLRFGPSSRRVTKDPNKYGWWNNTTMRLAAQGLCKEWFEVPRAERMEFAEYWYTDMDEESPPEYNVCLNPDFIEEISRCVLDTNDKAIAPRKGIKRRPGDTEWGHYDDRVYSFFGALLAHNSLPQAMDPRDIADQEEHRIMFEDFDQVAEVNAGGMIGGMIPARWSKGGIPRRNAGGR